MSLQVWLPLNGDLKNYGLDGSNIVTNYGATINNNGKIGKCYQNTASNYCTIPININSKEPFSLCFWYRIDTWSNWGTAITLNDNNDTYLGICPHSNGTQVGTNWYEGSTKVYDQYHSQTITVGVWYHISIVVDKTSVKTFINGIQTSANSNYSNTPTKSFTQLTLFKRGAASSVFGKNSLNDVRVYSHALSVKEVKEISKGLVLHYPLNNGGRGQQNYFINSNLYKGNTSYWYGVNNSSISIVQKDNRNTITATKGTSNYLFGQTVDSYNYIANSTVNITISADIYVEQVGTISINNWISTSQASGWQGMSYTQNYITGTSLKVGWNHVCVTQLNATNQYSGKIITAFGFSGKTMYLTNAKFEFGIKETGWCPSSSDSLYAAAGYNDTKESDTSGYQRHGILVSTFPTIDSDTPRYRCAYKYSGSTGNIHYNTTTDLNFIDNFSWSLWVKTNYTGNIAQYAFTVGRADAGGYGYGLHIASTSNCNIRFGNASYGVSVTGGQWTHLVFTKSGTTIKIYKNGELYFTNTFSGTLPTYSDGNGVGIGCFHYASGNIYPYYGSLSDFRVYATALSADDIKALYEDAGYVDKNGNFHAYEFVEG